MQLPSFITASTKKAVSVFVELHVVIHELGHLFGYLFMCALSGMRPGWFAIGLRCSEVPGDGFGKPLSLLTIGKEKGSGVCCYEKAETLSPRKRYLVSASGCLAEILFSLLLFTSLLIIDTFVDLDALAVVDEITVMLIYSTTVFLSSYVTTQSILNNWFGKRESCDGQKMKSEKARLLQKKQHLIEQYEGSPWKWGYERKKTARVLYLGMRELILMDRKGSDRIYFVNRSSRGVEYIMPAARRKARKRYLEIWSQYLPKTNPNPNKRSLVGFYDQNASR